MKVLVDTCVIIDVLQNRKPFSEYAQKIFMLAANNRIDAYITAKSVADVYYITHRYKHSDRETREIINKLYVLFKVADTTSEDCYNALSSGIKDYEDAIMSETARRIGVKWIITRNTEDYKKSIVSAISPEVFSTRENIY